MAKEKVTIELELSKITPDLIREIKVINGVTSVNHENRKLQIQMEHDKSVEISQTIIKHGALILLMKPKEYSLEEIFLKYYEGES